MVRQQQTVNVVSRAPIGVHPKIFLTYWPDILGAASIARARRLSLSVRSGLPRRASALTLSSRCDTSSLAQRLSAIRAVRPLGLDGLIAFRARGVLQRAAARA